MDKKILIFVPTIIDYHCSFWNPNDNQRINPNGLYECRLGIEHSIEEFIPVTNMGREYRGKNPKFFNSLSWNHDNLSDELKMWSHIFQIWAY